MKLVDEVKKRRWPPTKKMKARLHKRKAMLFDDIAKGIIERYSGALKELAK